MSDYNKRLTVAEIKYKNRLQNKGIDQVSELNGYNSNDNSVANLVNSQANNEIATESAGNFWDKTVSSYKEFMYNFSNGIFDFFEGIGDIGAGIVGVAADWFGNEDLKRGTENFIEYDWSKAAGKITADWGDLLSVGYNLYHGWTTNDWSHIDVTGNEPDKFAEYIYDNGYWDNSISVVDTIHKGANELTTTIGNMLPSIALGAATGGTSFAANAGASLSNTAVAGKIFGTGANAVAKGVSVGSMALSAAGQGTQEALLDGADLTSAVGYGLAAGAVEGATEYALGWLGEAASAGAKGISKLAGNSQTIAKLGTGLKELFPNTVNGLFAQNFSKKWFVQLAKEFVEEGTEEVLSDLANPLIKSIYNGKSVSENYADKDNLNVQDLAHSFIMGGLSTLVLGGGDIISQAKLGKGGRQLVQNITEKSSELSTQIIEAQKNNEFFTIDENGIQIPTQKGAELLLKEKQLQDETLNTYNDMTDSQKAELFRAITETSIKYRGAYLNEQVDKFTTEKNKYAEKANNAKTSAQKIEATYISELYDSQIKRVEAEIKEYNADKTKYLNNYVDNAIKQATEISKNSNQNILNEIEQGLMREGFANFTIEVPTQEEFDRLSNNSNASEGTFTPTLIQNIKGINYIYINPSYNLNNGQYIAHEIEHLKSNLDPNYTNANINAYNKLARENGEFALTYENIKKQIFEDYDFGIEGKMSFKESNMTADQYADYLFEPDAKDIPLINRARYYSDINRAKESYQRELIANVADNYINNTSELLKSMNYSEQSAISRALNLAFSKDSKTKKQILKINAENSRKASVNYNKTYAISTEMVNAKSKNKSDAKSIKKENQSEEQKRVVNKKKSLLEEFDATREENKKIEKIKKEKKTIHDSLYTKYYSESDVKERENQQTLYKHYVEKIDINNFDSDFKVITNEIKDIESSLVSHNGKPTITLENMSDLIEVTNTAAVFFKRLSKNANEVLGYLNKNELSEAQIDGINSKARKLGSDAYKEFKRVFELNRLKFIDYNSFEQTTNIETDINNKERQFDDFTEKMLKVGWLKNSKTGELIFDKEKIAADGYGDKIDRIISEYNELFDEVNGSEISKVTQDDLDTGFKIEKDTNPEYKEAREDLVNAFNNFVETIKNLQYQYKKGSKYKRNSFLDGLKSKTTITVNNELTRMFSNADRNDAYKQSFRSKSGDDRHRTIIKDNRGNSQYVIKEVGAREFNYVHQVERNLNPTNQSLLEEHGGTLAKQEGFYSSNNRSSYAIQDTKSGEYLFLNSRPANNGQTFVIEVVSNATTYDVKNKLLETLIQNKFSGKNVVLVETINKNQNQQKIWLNSSKFITTAIVSEKNKFAKLSFSVYDANGVVKNANVTPIQTTDYKKALSSTYTFLENKEKAIKESQKKKDKALAKIEKKAKQLEKTKLPTNAEVFDVGDTKEVANSERPTKEQSKLKRAVEEGNLNAFVVEQENGGEDIVKKVKESSRLKGVTPHDPNKGGSNFVVSKDTVRGGESPKGSIGVSEQASAQLDNAFNNLKKAETYTERGNAAVEVIKATKKAITDSNLMLKAQIYFTDEKAGLNRLLREVGIYDNYEDNDAIVQLIRSNPNVANDIKMKGFTYIYEDINGKTTEIKTSSLADIKNILSDIVSKEVAKHKEWTKKEKRLYSEKTKQELNAYLFNYLAIDRNNAKLVYTRDVLYKIRHELETNQYDLKEKEIRNLFETADKFMNKFRGENGVRNTASAQDIINLFGDMRAKINESLKDRPADLKKKVNDLFERNLQEMKASGQLELKLVYPKVLNDNLFGSNRSKYRRETLRFYPDLINDINALYDTGITNITERQWKRLLEETEKSEYYDKALEKNAENEWAHPEEHKTLVDVNRNLNNHVISYSNEMLLKANEVYEKKYGKENLRKWRESFYSYTKGYREMAFSENLISRNDINAMERLYPHYVPTQRELISNRRGYSQPNDTTRNIYKAKGSEQVIKDPLYVLSDMTDSLVRNATNNDIITLIREQMSEKGITNADFETIEFLKVSPSGVGEFVNKDILPKNLNIDQFVRDANESIEEGQQALFKYNDDGFTITTMSIDEDGTKHYYISKMSEEIYTAFSPTTKYSASKYFNNLGIFKATRKAVSLFKNLVTSWNPIFAVRNLARDIPDALLTTKNNSGKFIKEIPNSWAQITQNSELWQTYIKLGGVVESDFNAYMESMERQALNGGKQGIRAFTKPIELLDRLNFIAEQGTRFTEFKLSYERYIKEGLEVKEAGLKAVHDAQDITTNFSKGGSFVKLLNSNLVPFLNAQVQGACKMAHFIMRPRDSKEWAKLLILAFILGIAPSLLNELCYFNGEEYEALPEYTKESYYLIKITNGQFVKIPKGRIVGTLNSATRQAINVFAGKSDVGSATKQTLETTVSNLSPVDTTSGLRTIFAPIKDVKTNTTWYGQSIDKQSDLNKAPSQRYDSKTGSIAKFVGQTFNYSPKKIQYLLEQYTGVVGDILLPIGSQTTSKGTSANIGDNLLSYLKNNTTIDAVSNNKYIGEFYDLRTEILYKKNEGDSVATLQYSYMTRALNEINELEDKLDATNNEAERYTIYLTMREAYKQAIENTKLIGSKLENISISDDADRFSLAEAYRQCFGAEYALKYYSTNLYDKATVINKMGVSYDEYYRTYFELRNLSTKAERLKYINSIRGLSYYAKKLLYKTCGGALNKTEKANLYRYMTRNGFTEEELIAVGLLESE